MSADVGSKDHMMNFSKMADQSGLKISPDGSLQQSHEADNLSVQSCIHRT